MDAFYASVEQMDNPNLRGLPIAVGGSGIRGVVSAASYEARKFGVRSAMSGALARKKCPQLVFVPLRFERYVAISKQIRAIFFEYTDLVEPLSLDEAYLDVTNNKKGITSATHLAQEIRRRIYNEIGLTCSAGISVNKFVAKVASDVNKPNGQKTVGPSDVLSFLEGLEIEKFYGIGRVMSEKMKNLGIFCGVDLKMRSLEFLIHHFGKSGAHFYQIVRGIHESPVVANRMSKSVGSEQTFITDILQEDQLLQELMKIATDLHYRLKNKRISGKTLTLKIKYHDFSVQTRSKSFPFYISDVSLLFDAASTLLKQEQLKSSVRLLGLSLSNLNVQEKKKVSIQLRFDF